MIPEIHVRDVAGPSQSGLLFRRGPLLAAVLLAFAMTASAQTSSSWSSGCAGVSANTVGAVTWTPAECQEFNSTTVAPPDTTAWSFDVGNNGFGNNELETYCGPPGYAGNPTGCPTAFGASTANSYVDGKGHLVIQIVNNGGTWYSARIKTQGTQAFQYGRIEASAELPDLSNPGLWPAFWALGTNINAVSWPACGESDIMETWADATTCGPPAGNIVNHSTIHYGTSASQQANGGRYAFPSGEQMNTAFYAYGVIWSANMIQYYVNPPTPSSASTSTIAPFFIVTASDTKAGASWPYNMTNATTGPVFLLLNVAVGGTCGGALPTGSGPYQMLADYVRYYTPSAIPKPTLPTAPAITVAAGAASNNSSTFAPSFTPGAGYFYFSCDTTAPKASCSIQTTDPLDQYVVNSAASPAESVTVSVTTTSNAAALTDFFNPKSLRLLLVLAAIGIVLLIVEHFRPKPRKWQGAAGFASLVLLAILMMSCGGGAYGGAGGTYSGTPPGNYTVTVYAFSEANASNGANTNADAKVSIPVTVQ